MRAFVMRSYWKLLAYLLICTPCLAIDEFADVKLIRELPATELQVKLAYRLADLDNCELIPPGEPLEVNSIVSLLTVRDRRQKRPPLPASRTGFMTIGLELSQFDQSDLPLLSGGKIRDFLESNYVMLQVRVRRDLLDRRYYYHHRPIAVAAHFQGSRISRKFEALVAKTTIDIRSLGVFVQPQVKLLKAEYLRTLVLLYFNEMSNPVSGERVANHEWVFVRAREFGPTKILQHHLFVTEDNRQSLVRVRIMNTPSNPRACSLVGQISISDYDSTGLYPEDYVTRGYRTATVERFDWNKLALACEQKHSASINTRLDQVLDDIISGELSSADLSN